MRFSRPLQIQTSNGYARQALHTLPPPYIEIDNGKYGRLIQRCADHRLIRQGKQIHGHFVIFSVTGDNFLASKLIAFYSKSNHLGEARKVFDEIPHKNKYSWNALLLGYSLHNRYDDVLKLFTSFVSLGSPAKPDNFTLTCVLKALSSIHSSSLLAKMIHCFAIRHEFDSDIYVLNALLTYYCRCDDIVSARNLFDLMPERDLVSWNSMLAGYSQEGFYENCKGLYKEMLGLENVRPDGLTVVSVLQACAHSKDLILGMEVQKLLIDKGIEMDLSVCNAMISLYAKCGRLDYARELFNEMTERDEVTYGAIISGYMVHGFVDKAIDLFREIKNPGLSTWNAVISGQIQNNYYEGVINLFCEMQAFNLRPNPVTLSSILPTLSYFSNLKGGKEIHAYAIKNSFDNNIYVTTAMIDTYAKLGFLYGAQRIFDRSKVKSVIVWTAIISAYATHGDVDVVLHLFEQMLKERVQPDPVTFTAVLAACAHSGVVDEAWRVFYMMHPKYGIQPLMEHYNCMVAGLTRAGRLSEAAKFITNMPIEPSSMTWGTLLHGASVYSDVELGKFVCDKLFKIEPENTGNYIMMANLYSQAGRWEEAESVRRMMNDLGLKKVPGTSWIETPGGLQRFVAKDTSSERTEEIHAILEGLLELMIDEGYLLVDEFDVESISY